MDTENHRLFQELQDASKGKGRSGRRVGLHTAKVSNNTSGSKDGTLADATGGSETLNVTKAAHGKKGAGKTQVEAEEDYLDRPDVRIYIPDTVKSLLVDDWENVTRNEMLVPLPRDPNVAKILELFKKESPTKRSDSVEEETFDEIVSGLMLYFDKSLGTLLLYRFEREQYLDIMKEHPDTKPSDIYGAEHLLRLCGISHPIIPTRHH
jgi:mortality factor 4-like protein 1